MSPVCSLLPSYQLPTACCLLPVTCCLLSAAARYQLSATSCLFVACCVCICCLLLPIYQLSAVCYL
jgi:hypothetical protein